MPHLISECIQDLGKSIDFEWPKVESKYLDDLNVDLVIQINGKKKDIITINKGLEEKKVLDISLKKPKINKYIANKKIFKTIYVKDRLINIITK